MECDVKPNEDSNLPQTAACNSLQRNTFSPQEFILHSYEFKNEAKVQQLFNKLAIKTWNVTVKTHVQSFLDSSIHFPCWLLNAFHYRRGLEPIKEL